MNKIAKECMNYDGDPDCNKCCKHGYIYVCPEDCEDYIDFWGNKKMPENEANYELQRSKRRS